MSKATCQLTVSIANFHSGYRDPVTTVSNAFDYDSSEAETMVVDDEPLTIELGMQGWLVLGIGHACMIDFVSIDEGSTISKEVSGTLSVPTDLFDKIILSNQSHRRDKNGDKLVDALGFYTYIDNPNPLKVAVFKYINA